MIKVQVYSVILMPQIGQYLITLEELKGVRLIPIWVGPAEGMAISAELENQKLPRPMTHDLIINILEKMNARIKKIVITDLKGSTFYAIMNVSFNKKTLHVDARPSDAIALALRSKAPIYIEESVFNKCPVIQKPITKDEVDDFKKELQNLRPQDFFKDA